MLCPLPLEGSSGQPWKSQRPVVLKPECAQNLLEGFLQYRGQASPPERLLLHLRCSLRTCVSSKFPGDADDAVGAVITLWDPLRGTVGAQGPGESRGPREGRSDAPWDCPSRGKAQPWVLPLLISCLPFQCGEPGGKVLRHWSTVLADASAG